MSGRRTTNLQEAEMKWEHEGWGEPFDDRQRDLWVAFFLGRVCDPDAPFVPRPWTRPAGWIEDLIRVAHDG